LDRLERGEQASNHPEGHHRETVALGFTAY
jgi:hypothetical protein